MNWLTDRMTSYLCFLPVAGGYGYSFAVYRAPAAVEWILAVVCTLAMTYLVIVLPEARLKSESSPYAYNWGRRDFEKFSE